MESGPPGSKPPMPPGAPHLPGLLLPRPPVPGGTSSSLASGSKNKCSGCSEGIEELETLQMDALLVAMFQDEVADLTLLPS